MRKNSNEMTTLAHLRRAMKQGRPVTISYIKADGSETIWTIEIYEIPEDLTKDGKQIIKAMDRDVQSNRTWRLDRIKFYTIHKSGYTVPRGEDHNVHPGYCCELHPYKWCDEHQMPVPECYDLHLDLIDSYIKHAIS